VRSRDTLRSLFDTDLTLDLEPLFAVPDTTVFASAYVIAGRNGSANSGDFQVLSDIDAPSGSYIAELGSPGRSFPRRTRRGAAGRCDAAPHATNGAAEVGRVTRPGPTAATDAVDQPARIARARASCSASRNASVSA
jgi:hypothetical protein